MAITPLPPAPQISDTPAEFNTKAFAFVDALPTMVTEINAELPNIDAVSDAADAALGAANFKGEWSTLSGALNIPASVSHNGDVWVLTESLADVTSNEPGVDSPNLWIKASADLVAPVGALQYFAGVTTSTYPGDGWLKCDNSIVTQSAYPDIFDIVGLLPSPGYKVWTQAISNSLNSSLRYLNGIFIVGLSANGLSNIRTSTNGITWETQTVPVNNQKNDFAYGNGVYVYVGQGGVVGTSTNAVTWTARTSVTASAIYAITYGTVFCSGGVNGILVTSTNGSTWTARTSGTASSINDLIYGDSLYVYAGAGGVLATSTDAITWTARTSGTTSPINSLLYADGLYVYAGVGGVLATSTDAITWTARTAVAANNITSLAYFNGNYYYLDNFGRVAKSADAISWNQIATVTSFLAIAGDNDNTAVISGADGAYYSNRYDYDLNTEFALPTQSTDDAPLVDLSADLYIKTKI